MPFIYNRQNEIDEFDKLISEATQTSLKKEYEYAQEKLITDKLKKKEEYELKDKFFSSQAMSDFAELIGYDVGVLEHYYNIIKNNSNNSNIKNDPVNVKKEKMDTFGKNSNMFGMFDNVPNVCVY